MGKARVCFITFTTLNFRFGQLLFSTEVIWQENIKLSFTFADKLEIFEGNNNVLRKLSEREVSYFLASGAKLEPKLMRLPE